MGPGSPADIATKGRKTPAVERKRKHKAGNPEVSVEVPAFPLTRCVN